MRPMDVTLGDIVTTRDGKRRVVCIDRLAETVRLAPVDWVPPESIDEDPRFTGPDVPWSEVTP